MEQAWFTGSLWLNNSQDEKMDLAFYKDRLSAAGVSFDDGLTDDEFSTIEREYGFHFPTRPQRISELRASCIRRVARLETGKSHGDPETIGMAA